MEVIEYKPYTYLIGWSKLNKWYYGCSYAKNCHPDQLWFKYFTSSKYVKKFRKENGEPDIVQIRKTFTNKQQCKLWEHKVLSRMSVVWSEKWLNRTDSSGKLIALPGWKHSSTTLQKMRKPKSLEHRQSISRAKKGKPFTGHGAYTKEVIEKRASKRRGAKLSEKSRENMSKAHKGKPWSEARRLAQLNRRS
jgi:hypothetical protein